MRPVAKVDWQDAYSIIEPQIGADGVHAWPFDPGFPIDVRFLTFGRQRDIRNNRHEYFEILHVQSGRVIYEVQDRFLTLEPGDLFVMGSTLMHGMSEYLTPHVNAAVLYFHPELVRRGESGGEDAEYLMPFLVQDDGFPHVVPARTGIPAQIFDLMKRVASELPAGSSRARLSVKTYLKMILVLLVNHFADFRGSEGVFVRRQRDIDRLKPLFAYIDKHYPEPMTVEDAASVAAMSKSTFMRFFKQVTGQSFVAYLNRFRIAKAETLLSSTGLSFADVSQQVGFCDQSYFGHVFRGILNVTPREYRERVEAARK